MIIKKSVNDLSPEIVKEAKNTKIRWMLGPKDNVPNFYLRVFDLEKGGESPYHNHPWEHEVFILEGKGYLRTEEKNYDFKPYDVLYVPPGTQHQFVNKGDGLLRFICIIPKQ